MTSLRMTEPTSPRWSHNCSPGSRSTALPPQRVKYLRTSANVLHCTSPSPGHSPSAVPPTMRLPVHLRQVAQLTAVTHQARVSAAVLS